MDASEKIFEILCETNGACDGVDRILAEICCETCKYWGKHTESPVIGYCRNSGSAAFSKESTSFFGCWKWESK